MRRWNGWGDETLRFPVPSLALGYRDALGLGTHRATPPSGTSLSMVPSTRLTRGVLLQNRPGGAPPPRPGPKFARLGCPARRPHFRPHRRRGLPRIRRRRSPSCASPTGRGRGSSLTGGNERRRLTSRRPQARPLSPHCGHGRMSRMARLDGPAAWPRSAPAWRALPEAQFRAPRIHLGHYPMPFDYTLGGWVATRSSGQQSAY